MLLFFLLGADRYGRDLLSRMIYGARISLSVGLIGILVCSLLGGMKAVTWTQVAQYIILIIAYLVPPVVMSQRVTGVPIPEIMYGQILQKIDAKEKAINADPKEIEVMGLWKKEVEKLDADIKGLPGSLDAKKAEAIVAACDEVWRSFRVPTVFYGR